MSRKTATIPPEYFEQKYQADIDPWQFRSSDYEKEKYASTIRALGKPHYGKALEIGCSIGVLTRALAPRCGSLTAIDASATAIAAAKLSDPPSNVAFDVRVLPEDFPAGKFDLIVLSEVLYYFSPSDLKRVAKQCLDALSPDGELLLCHWLGETDYPLSGAEASVLMAEAMGGAMRLHSIVVDDVYRLERFEGFSISSGDCAKSNGR